MLHVCQVLPVLYLALQAAVLVLSLSSASLNFGAFSRTPTMLLHYC